MLSIFQMKDVEHIPDEGPPVSAETWLAVKAKLLALLAEVIDE